MSDNVSVARRVVGGALLLVGVVLILGQTTDLDLGELWPLFVLVPGAALLVSGMLGSGGYRTVGTMIGSVVTMLGLLLTYQAATGHWESWAYAWALVSPGAVGVGLWLSGMRAGNDQRKRKGARVAGLGLAFFVIGFAFFEGVMGISGRDLGVVGELLLPSLIVLAGLWLILRPRRKPVQPPEVHDGV